ncbi:MAG TPA: glycosyltransferase family 87 protein [Verrucomicrobiae bacterium]
MSTASTTGWRFTRSEKYWLIAALILILGFGALLERRTALRHEPMTDLGVFCIASGAVWSGLNPYDIPDWHGWHYQYPPALAIAFFPLAEPVPLPAALLPPEKLRTAQNTPWGYGFRGDNYYGLRTENTHFFFVVAVWYLLSVAGILLSAHAIGCALEQTPLRGPPPVAVPARRRWWLRRLLPLAVCAGSLGTDLSRGQADILMLTAICLAIYGLANRQWFRAGLSLAVPATIKLFPPFLLAYPLLRRQWQAALGVGVGLIFLLGLLPVATLGPNRTAELYRCWFDVLAKPALGHGTDTSRQSELTGMGSTDNQSLLAAVHNWAHRSTPRAQRPVEAAPWERQTVYFAGIGLIMAALWAIGWRRQDSPHQLCLVAGLLVGIALLINPVVHNFYYLLLLPLVAALLDLGLQRNENGRPAWRWLWPVILFFAADLLARVPGIGTVLRDWSITTLSLLIILATAAWAARRVKPQ